MSGTIELPRVLRNSWGEWGNKIDERPYAGNCIAHMVKVESLDEIASALLQRYSVTSDETERQRLQDAFAPRKAGE